MKITTKTTLTQFIRIAAILPITTQAKEQMAAIKSPTQIKARVVPNSLDGITMGQLLELQNIEPANTLTEPARIILGIDSDALKRCSAIEVIGFNNFIAQQMVKIAKMFGDIPSLITPEERRAGAEKLDFGTFGLIDAYAKRMGITNHDDVLNVKWLHIWKVLYNDAQTALYERRLRTIYNPQK